MDLVQIAVVGASGVGKSTLIKAYTGSSDPPTKNVTYRKRHFAIRFIELSLQAAQLHSPDAMIAVIDVTDERSYNNCLEALQGSKTPMILLGNKCDLEERRSLEVVRAVRGATQRKLLYEECSALHGDHIDASLFLLLDLLVDHKRSSSCLQWTERSRSRLQLLCTCLSVATMLQGLGMVMYGGYFVVHIDQDSTDWLGDAFMLSGVLTFVISFIGFYGSKSRGIKEYLKVVKSMQYGVLLALTAVAKLAFLLVFAGSEATGGSMYSQLRQAIGYREWMSCSLALEVTASCVSFLCMKSVVQSLEGSSYSQFFRREE